MQQQEEDIVSPFNIQAVSERGIEYGRYAERKKLERVNEEIKERIERITGGKVHRYLRRGIFFAHKEMEKVIREVEEKRPVYLLISKSP